MVDQPSFIPRMDFVVLYAMILPMYARTVVLIQLKEFCRTLSKLMIEDHVFHLDENKFKGSIFIDISFFNFVLACLFFSTCFSNWLLSQLVLVA